MKTASALQKDILSHFQKLETGNVKFYSNWRGLNLLGVVATILKWDEISAFIQASWISQDRTLYASSNGTIYKSIDNGRTFASLESFKCQGIDCVFVSKKGDLFLSLGVGSNKNGCGLWRSINGGASWEKTLALPECCSIWSLGEDHSGTLFAGVYTRGKAKRAQIHLSRDDGRNWRPVYWDSGARHVHQISVDNDNGHVYASVGDKSAPESNIAYLIRSVDQGNSWHKILPELPQILAVQAIDGARILGTDDSCNGQLYRTVDDITFEKVLDTGDHNYCFWIRQCGPKGRLFASFVAGEANPRTAGIYTSADMGVTWELWQSFAATAAYEGSTRATNFFDGCMYVSLRLGGNRKKGFRISDC